MSGQNMFSNFIKAFLSIIDMKWNKENIIFVFQGFPVNFYTSLEDEEVVHISEKWDMKYVNYDSLIRNKEILMKFLGNRGKRWAFYEEFVAVANIINDFSLIDSEIIIVRNDLFDGYYPIPVDNQKLLIKAIDDEGNRTEYSVLQYYSDYKLEANKCLISYVNKHFHLDTNREFDIINFYETIAEKFSKVRKENLVTENIMISSLPELKCSLQAGEIRDKHFVILNDVAKSSVEVNVLNTLGSVNNVFFSYIDKSVKDNSINSTYVDLLHKYWGEAANFRTLKIYSDPAVNAEVVDVSQGVIIADIIEQCKNALDENNQQYSDIIVTAPTGAGKSIFFQIPGIYLHECDERKPLTIIICPLVALMVDQVKELKEERGINYATYINSAISYEERIERLEGIKSGRYSIVYLSPELLLAYDIRSLIGDRKIGLVVIDEAHLVTSWGRDFRVDYWFLGDYIEKIRRGSSMSKNKEINFPVLCLTATAVFGGRDDIIGEFQSSLHLTCYSEHMYIGYVKRDNVEFKIRASEKVCKSDKEEKVRLTSKAIGEFVVNAEKSIVYCPYKSQIEDVRNKINDSMPHIARNVERYYSGEMIQREKDDAYNNFKNGKSLVMLATKAFGMGVNISDIINVYHYAPTGTLADYVQEIGRAARKLDKGYAIIDYIRSDMHYAQTLWGLSGLRHYQLKAIIKKLYSLYEEKGRRNLLFSPETFSFLFDDTSVDMKVKSGLMLLSTDLLDKYHFKVITVRPKNLFSKQYIIVPDSISSQFLKEYGKYCELMNDNFAQKELAYANKSDVVTTKIGNIYEIDLGRLWENKFADYTFAQFKAKFFQGELIRFDNQDDKVIPNIKLVISYHKGYHEIKDRFYMLAKAIQDTFLTLKRKYGGRNFTSKEFVDIFNSNFDSGLRKEYILMLLDLFCYENIDPMAGKEQWKFIERRTENNGKLYEETMYCIRTQKYAYIQPNLRRYFMQAEPNMPGGNKYVAYITLPKKGAIITYQQLMASILQLFDFATYEYIGGRNPQIFVRINDPLKLKRLAEYDKPYKNNILVNIEERHKRAVKIMNSFMNNSYSNEERWNIIEYYFLGMDDVVDSMLKISFDKKVKKDINKLDEQDEKHIVFEPGEKMIDYYSNWDEADGLPLASECWNHCIPVPDYINSKLIFGNETFELMYVWDKAKIAIIDGSYGGAQRNIGEWNCYYSADVNLTELKLSLVEA